MSEFKFACPVCAQHITADSSSTGTQIECPTCFQKIVVPQAPSSPDSKFILSAAQVSKPRPTGYNGASASEGPPARKAMPMVLAGVAVVLLACGAGAYIFRDKIFKSAQQRGGQTSAGSEEAEKPTGSANKQANAQPIPARPIPTNIVWTLDLTNAEFPDSLASGNIHGQGFQCDRATLQGGNLSLRVGRSGPIGLGVSVLLFAQQGEELGGKTVQVSPDQTPPLPKVTLRWTDDAQQRKSRTFNSGYALKVQFGPAASGRVSGKLYLSLPDEANSVVAGTFDAEIRKPAPPKTPKPKPPGSTSPSQPRPQSQPRPPDV